ncbi:S-layer homology domain-containing protein [Oscillibacter sp. MSJ-2]|uniref:S-layer homology domain-containing protein n=1 Tax=Dysosmobacter acutus TaxID=2841504 RepID=A0ABS6F6R8_9FIRM|nr:S-layer homology domain-containing protein [Dysosmobacter acutus]MBU5625973.1 S-layer homology domain-containing protein [Dysosmobacter acutus]
MKRRLLALLLCAALLCTGTALAAEDSMENFTRVKTYTRQFSDLAPASAHYKSVAALYEYGLTVGKGNGTFGVQDSLSVGEAVVFAGRIRSLYRTGDAEAGANGYRSAAGTLEEPYRTYVPYLSYLQAEAVLGSELEGVLDKAATRAQMAHVLAHVLPDSALPSINDQAVTEGYATGRYITDVTEYTPYQPDILKLYKCGILQGSGSTGTFRPASNITRGEAASMLSRMVDESLRLQLDWSAAPDYSAVGTTMADLVPTAQFVANPASAAEIRGNVRSMLASGQRTMSLQYPGNSLTASFVNNLLNSALTNVKSYCEQMYNTVSCTYDLAKGTVKLNFSAASSTASQLSSYRSFSMDRAIEVHDQLWESGEITADMTEYDKARVYYAWVCENCYYDQGASDLSLSHLAYSVFAYGKAVCDGYTGAYNLLLKLEGIQCYGLSNADHIWTVANLDGTDYHIDTTWGDSGAKTDYAYFGMTSAQSWAAHPW